MGPTGPSGLLDADDVSSTQKHETKDAADDETREKQTQMHVCVGICHFALAIVENQVCPLQIPAFAHQFECLIGFMADFFDQTHQVYNFPQAGV